DLDEYNELVIWGPLRLTVPPVGDCPLEDVVIDPEDVPVALRPLLDFLGSTRTTALYYDYGHLRLKFSSGYWIYVAGDGNRPARELYGKYHGYMACLPRGRVRVVRHDIPGEHDSAPAVAR